MITINYASASLDKDCNDAAGEFVNGILWGDDKDKAIKDYCSMSVYEDGKLIAATLYHNFYESEGVVELSSASISKRWLCRRVINAMFNMAFNILPCQIAVLRVSSANHGMLKIARSFGFHEQVIERLRGRYEDEHVFTLTDDQWLKHKANNTAR